MLDIKGYINNNKFHSFVLIFPLWNKSIEWNKKGNSMQKLVEPLP